MICQPLEIRYQYPPPPSSSINHPSSSPRMKKNRPGTHPLSLRLGAFWHLNSCHFDTKNGFSGIWRSSWWTVMFVKMPTGSPLRSSHCFSPARSFTARLLFSLICTEQEPGTGQLAQKLQKLSRKSEGDTLRAQTYFWSSLLFTWNVKKRDDQ